MNAAGEDNASSAWARILPFLRPIEVLIGDPDISDIMVNGDRAVFFEKHGRVELFSGVTIAEKSLQVAVRNIARALGGEISEEAPILDSRLPDGSRVSAVLAPISVNGTTLTIRKFQNKRYNADELVRVGMLPQELLQQLQQAVLNRKNILISGGTGTGKTTLLNALAAFIPDEERVIVIEDTSEVQIGQPNTVRLEGRREQQGLASITIRDLLRAALRMRPDRILLGEVRGDEAFDLLQSMNTGHSGSLCTIHASSGRQTLTRFATCILMSGIELSQKTINVNIAEALDFVVHIERRQGKRYVSEILGVDAYDLAHDRYDFRPLYSKETT